MDKNLRTKLEQENASAQRSASSGQKQKVKDDASNSSSRPSRNQDKDEARDVKGDAAKRRGMGR